MTAQNMRVRNSFGCEVGILQQEIGTLDNKVEYFELFDTSTKRRCRNQRWEILINGSQNFSKALYVFAKKKPEEFRLMYYMLKQNDPEFFQMAAKILQKIQTEYNFI